MGHAGFGSESNDPRRRLPRHATDVVECALGKVIDLSGSGMQLSIKDRCSLKVGQTVPLKLMTPSGSVAVHAQVVWRRRTGLFRGAMLGLRFVGITPGQSVALATIARFGFLSQEGMQIASHSAAASAKRPTPPPAPNRGAAPHVADTLASVEAGLVMAEYYDRLGLTPQATAEQIKEAYRRLARQVHPDVAPGPENQQKFVALREAYDLLTDHRRRAG